VNRRKLLIGSGCTAISYQAMGFDHWNTVLNIEESLKDGCTILSNNSLQEHQSRTAIFVLGARESFLTEIIQLELPFSTITYFDGSTYGPNAEQYLGEIWKIDQARIRKINGTKTYVQQAVNESDNVLLFGNYSATFASRALASLATTARGVNRPVVAIGEIPTPGAQGKIRVRRGWNCIHELESTGCRVVTIPNQINVDYLQHETHLLTRIFGDQTVSSAKHSL
jgi:hypothetical protein